MLHIKNTNSAIIHSILTTFLLLALVSCKTTTSTTTSTEESSEIIREEKSEHAKAKTVISTARSYIGTRYRSGESSKRGMDCSGLTLTAFKSANIALPRTAGEQSKMGKPVPLNDLKPGDLIFFTDRKGHKKITHVGIVTEVKGKKEVRFIHASTKSGVVEENLFVDWYLPLFIKGSRIF